MIPLQYEKTAKQWTKPSVKREKFFIINVSIIFKEETFYFHLFQNISNGLMDGFLFPPKCTRVIYSKSFRAVGKSKQWTKRGP